MPGESDPVVTAAPVRLQRSRSKGSRLVSPNGLAIVCVTRPGIFGNPFASRFYGKEWAVSMFRLFLQSKWSEIERRMGVRSTPTAMLIFGVMELQMRRHRLTKRLGEIRGCNLACWCKPGEPCHADALLKFANSPPRVPAAPAQQGEVTNA